MKSIKIYNISRHEENLRMMKRIPVEVDLSALEQFYSAMGEKHRRSFLKFNDYWKNEGCEKFFNPKAVVRSLSIETAAENFGVEMLLEDSADQAVMVVWTIGSELEKEVSMMISSLRNLMTGFLLDVAGSIALYEMHAKLIVWIRQNIVAPNNKFINGEFYPGIGSMRQDLMEKVVTFGETERLIGVSASGNSMLRPRKSQCSFIVLGADEHEMRVKMEPCNPCVGKKCLYYQLGGCHMIMGSKTESGYYAPPDGQKLSWFPRI